MRKKLFLFMTIIVILSFSACGSSEKKISDALNGTIWGTEDEVKYGMLINHWYFYESEIYLVAYDDDIAEDGYQDNLGELTGDYVVEEDYISITWSDPSLFDMPKVYYSFDNGEIILFRDEDKTIPLDFLGYYDDISESEAETIAKSAIVNMCCEESYVSTVNIDYGTFEITKFNNRYEAFARGTYRPKDSFGMYGELMTFNVKLSILPWNGEVNIIFDNYDEAY